MSMQVAKQISVVIVLLFFNGCAIFNPNQSPQTEVFDPLVERNTQWQKHVNRGNWEFQNQNFPQAVAAYRAALAVKPQSSGVQRKIAEIYFQQQEYEEAAAEFASFLKLNPENTIVRNYLGYTYEKLNDYQAAGREYERTLKHDPDNLYALNHLGLAYKQTKRLDDADQILRKALSLDPRCRRSESKNLHNYLASIHLERGEIGDAIAEFRESARLFPSAIWPRQQLAALFEARERYYEAQLQYQEILKIDPENLLAPTRLHALAKTHPEYSTSSHNLPVDIVDVDIQTIIKHGSDVSDFPNADVIILLNHFSHDVLPTGQSRYTTHQLVKLLTERGIEKYDDIAIPYQPTAQNITVNIAHTITPDGVLVKPPAEAYNVVTPPGLLSHNLYSDIVWKVISMPALSPGAIIEYQVTLESREVYPVGSQSWVSGGFNFQATDPTRQAIFALRIPNDLTFKWKTDNCELIPQLFHEDETNTYLWSHDKIPALKEESGMPAIEDVTHRLSYSSVNSWDDVYTWYRDLAKDRYVVDETIETIVHNLTKTLPTIEDKIRAIYDYVTSQIRYVGIELGQSAYQPSHASEVIRNLYGDCKDKTTLMITMLDLIGVKAFPVLLNPAPHERVDPDMPSISQFSHMIAAIATNDGYTWVDPASSTCRYGNLPDRDQGRKGFLIGDHKAMFVDIPIFPAHANQLQVKTEIQLTEQGTAEGEISVKTKGQYNLDSRFRYRSIAPGDWKNTIAVELSKQFPGISVDWVKFTNLENLNQPVEILAGFHVDNYVQSIGTRMLLPLPIDEFAGFGELFAPATRQHSLNLGHPMQIQKEILISVPNHWQVSLPRDLNTESDFATLERRYSRDGNVIRYSLRFTLRKSIIASKDYHTAKRFFDTLAKEDHGRLIMERIEVD